MTTYRVGDLAGVQIVKTGSGVWTLSGSSDYTGGFSLENGRVVLSGTLACTGNIDVQSSGTLELSSGTLRSPPFPLTRPASCPASV